MAPDAAPEVSARTPSGTRGATRQPETAALIAAARSLMDRRQYPQALEELKKADRQEPDSAEILHLMGVCCSRDRGGLLHWGRETQAFEYLQRALTADPAHAAAHIALAQLFQAKDRPDEAEEHLTRARQADPADPVAAAELGRLLFQQRKFAAAVAELLASLQRDPAQPETALLAVRCLVLTRDTVPLTALVESLLRLSPDASEAHYYAGRAQALCGRLEEAAESFRRAARLDPSNALARFQLGVVHLEGARYDAAQAEFKAARDADARSPLPHHGLGKLHLRQRRVEPAFEELRRALAAGGDSAELRVDMAQAHWMANDRARAMSELEQARTLDRSFVPTFLIAAQFLAADGKTADALAQLARAQLLAPNDPQIRLRRAQLLVKLGQPREATEEFRGACALAPTDGELALAFGRHQMESGDLADALATLSRAVALRPDDGEAAWAYGRALLADGRPGEAREPLERAVAALPRRADVLLDLARSQRDGGSPGDALRAFEQASRMDAVLPDLPAEWARALAAAGAQALRDGNASESVGHFRAACALVPEMPQAHEGLAEALVAAAVQAKSSQGADAALALAIQALRERPDWPPAARLAAECHRERAQHLASQNRFADAETGFRQALSLDAADAPSADGLVAVLLSAGRRADAVRTGADFVRAHPVPAAFLARLAGAMTEADRAEEALALFRLAAYRSPEDDATGELFFDDLLAQAQRMRGKDVAAAVAALREAAPLAARGAARSERLDAALAQIVEALLSELRFDEAASLLRETGQGAPARDLLLARALSGRGAELLSSGDLEAAERTLVESLAARPTAESHLRLAHAYERLDRGADALLQLERAHALAPEHPEPVAKLSRIYLTAGRLDESAAMVSRLSGLVPDAPTLPDLAAEIAFQRGARAEGQDDAVRALAYYREALSSVPRHPMALRRAADLELAAGREAMARGDAVEAAARCEAALRCAPDLTEAQQGLAAALVVQSKDRPPAEAATLLRRAATLAPDRADTQEALGLALEAAGERAAAADALAQALRLDAARLEARLAMARIALAGDDLDAAAAQLSAARDACGEDARVLLALAEVAQRRGDDAAAVTFLRDAQGLPGGLPAARDRLHALLRARVEPLVAAQRHDEAARACAEALETAPDDADLWMIQGISLYKLRRAAQARESLTRAVTLAPGRAAPYHYLGLLDAAAGDVDAAAARFEKAVSLDADLAHAHLNLAQIHVKRGDADRAIASLEAHVAAAGRTAAEPEPRAVAQLSDCLNNRGVSRYRRGEHEIAYADLARAVEVTPGRPAVAANLCRAAARLTAARRAAGDAAGAAEAAAVWRRHAPDDPAPAREHADLLLALGRAEESLSALERVRALSGPASDTGTALLFGRALLALARGEEALAWLLRSGEDEARRLVAETRARLAEEALSRRAFDRAIELLEALRAEAPAPAAADASLQRAYRARADERVEERPADALEDMARAEAAGAGADSLAEARGRAHTAIGDGRRDTGDAAGAERAYREALSFSFSAGRIFVLSTLLRAQGRPVEAVSLLDGAHDRVSGAERERLEAETALALRAAAAGSREAGDPRSAEAQLVRALALLPSEDTRGELADLRFDEGMRLSASDPAAAERRLAAVLEMRPADAPARAALARLSFARGDARTAKEHLSAALSAPSDPQVRAEARGLLARVDLALARSELAERRFGPAEALLEEARGAGAPDDELSALALTLHRSAAVAAREAGDLGGALARTEAAAALSPADDALAADAAALLVALGRNADARDRYRALAERVGSDPEVWVVFADLSLGLGDEAGASEGFERALGLAPDHARARSGLAQVLRQGAGRFLVERRYEEGVVRFQRLADLDPTAAESHHNLGLCLLKLGRLDDAAVAFAAALSRDAFHLASSVRLGWCHERRGATADAVQEYRKATVVDENHALAHAALGSALVHDDPAGALDELRRAQELELALPELSANLAVAWLRAGRLTEGRQAIVAAVRQDGGATVHVARGYLLASEGNLQEARQAFEQALALDPNNIEARNDLACVFDMLRRYDAALEEFARASELAPQNATVLANRSVALRSRGLLKESEECLRLALALGPDSPGANVNQALLLRQQGRLDGAVELLQKAVNLLAPRRADPKINLAICLIESRKLSDALIELQAAAQLRPDDAEVHLLIGFVQQQKNALPDAIRSYQRASELDPKNWMVHNNLAIALLKRGDPQSWQACQSEFKLAMRSNEASEHIGRGFGHLSSGSLHEARAEWSKVAAVRPEPRPARELLLAVADVVSAAEARGIAFA